MKREIKKIVYLGNVSRNHLSGETYTIGGEQIDLDKLLFDFRYKTVRITIEEVEENDGKWHTL